MGRKKVEINELSKDRLKMLCERKKITQTELAKATGYTPHAISQVVTGKKGLSSQLADAIVAAYPDVSRDWLMGDPNVKMSRTEKFFTTYKDALKKRQALDGLLAFTEYTIDYEKPYEIEGFRERFYNVTRHSDSVAVTDRQLEFLVNSVIDIVTSLLKYTFESGKSATQLAEDSSVFAEHYLNGLCDFLLDSDIDDDEKKCIANFVPQAVKCIGSRSFECPIYPDKSESEVLRKEEEEYFKEFQDE